MSASQRKETPPYPEPNGENTPTTYIDYPGGDDGGILTAEGGIGQHEKKCPTVPVILFSNTSGNRITVSGDLKIDKKSCPVVFNGDPGGRSFTFAPGYNAGAALEVASGRQLIAACAKGKQCLCKWSFTRTSP